MAKTNFATNDPEVVKLWSEQLYRDVLKGVFFSNYMGGSDAIVHTKTDFEKKQGDRMTFAIRMKLAGNGVTEGQTLEGNEEKLTDYTFNLTLGEVAHAVRDAGAMARQRAMFDISMESEDSLRDWGTEKVDGDCFTEICTSPTKIFYGGTSSATSTLTSSDKLTTSLISKMAAWAKTGGGRTAIPIRPVKIDGGQYYVLLVSHDVGYDLRVDTTWAQAQRDAQTRGSSNPIFSGALGIWSNVLVVESEFIPQVTNWGSGANVAGAKCVMLGAQALTFGWGRKPKIVQKMFDYDREMGYGMSMIYGVEKPVFNSQDFGSVACYVARTQIS